MAAAVLNRYDSGLIFTRFTVGRPAAVEPYFQHSVRGENQCALELHGS
jgi:hypothetical protein